MKKPLLALAAACLLSGCYVGGGYAPGPYAGGPGPGPGAYDVYYDGFYGAGPIYDGYWGRDGVFVYRTGYGRPWIRDVDRHFRREPGPGFRTIHIAPRPHPDADRR